jgi:sec-independent protein translocase protein TatA
MLDNLFQPTHLLFVLVIALLVFGPKKLPELGKGLGEGIRSFKDSMNAKDESTSKTEEKKP